MGIKSYLIINCLGNCNFNADVNSVPGFVYRYNRISREWTQKYAM